MVSRIINGFEMEFERKRIKKMHLRIRKDGSVLLTAPMRVSDEEIVRFVTDEEEWLREHQSRILAICERQSHRFDDGSTVKVLGKDFRIVIETSERPGISAEDDNIVMHIPEGSSFEDKESLINEFYRGKLKERLSVLVPKWESAMGLQCSSWQTKIMTTRWGTCNTRTKKVWFSVRLAEKSEDLIEYVIVHELAHILVNNHGPDFKRLLDVYVPDWREKRKRLNS